MLPIWKRPRASLRASACGPTPGAELLTDTIAPSSTFPSASTTTPATRKAAAVAIRISMPAGEQLRRNRRGGHRHHTDVDERLAVAVDNAPGDRAAAVEKDVRIFERLSRGDGDRRHSHRRRWTLREPRLLRGYTIFAGLDAIEHVAAVSVGEQLRRGRRRYAV